MWHHLGIQRISMHNLIELISNVILAYSRFPVERWSKITISHF